VSLEVTVRADEVRWRQTGALTLRAWAEPAGVKVEESVSTGLPRPIPAQVTFRNVEWRLTVAAALAEAMGLDAQPKDQSQTRTEEEEEP